MFCANAREFLLTTVTRSVDGRLFQNTRRPPCRQWTCPQCKTYRMHKAAAHLLDVVPYGADVYVARVPKDRVRTVERNHQRRGGEGRVIIGLGDHHLHIADVDCLTQQRVAKGKPTWPVLRCTVEEAAAELHDPTIPVTRGPRWIGTWRPDEPPAAVLALTMTLTKDERETFTHIFDLDPWLLRGTHVDVPEATVTRLNGCWEWWRINVRGEQPRGVPLVEPVH